MFLSNGSDLFYFFFSENSHVKCSLQTSKQKKKKNVIIKIADAEFSRHNFPWWMKWIARLACIHLVRPYYRFLCHRKQLQPLPRHLQWLTVPQNRPTTNTIMPKMITSHTSRCKCEIDVYLHRKHLVPAVSMYKFPFVRLSCLPRGIHRWWWMAIRPLANHLVVHQVELVSYNPSRSMCNWHHRRFPDQNTWSVEFFYWKNRTFRLFSLQQCRWSRAPCNSDVMWFSRPYTVCHRHPLTYSYRLKWIDSPVCSRRHNERRSVRMSAIQLNRHNCASTLFGRSERMPNTRAPLLATIFDMDTFFSMFRRQQCAILVQLQSRPSNKCAKKCQRNILINPCLRNEKCWAIEIHTRDTPNYKIGSELLRLRKRDFYFIYISSINGTHAHQFPIPNRVCVCPPLYYAQCTRMRSSTIQIISFRNIIRQNRFSYQWICTQHAIFCWNVGAHCTACHRHGTHFVMCHFRAKFRGSHFDADPFDNTFDLFRAFLSTHRRKKQFSRRCFFFFLFSKLVRSGTFKMSIYTLIVDSVNVWTNNSQKMLRKMSWQELKSKPEHEIGERDKWRQNKCESNVAQAHTPDRRIR